MLKISVCDDDVHELHKTIELCEAYREKNPETELHFRAFSSCLALQESLDRGEKYDVYLLDIFMPEMPGTAFAKVLRERGEDCQLIFLTSSQQHAIEAFSLHAAHYLVKPYTAEQFEDALNKAIRSIEKKSRACLTVKTSGGVQRLSFSDFIWAESDKHIQKIYLADGNCLQVRISSSELFERLSFDKRFFKCGSSYIINVGKVDELTRHQVIFETGQKIPMLRRQYKDLVDRYTAYALEGR